MVPAKILDRTQWAPGLWSLRLEAELDNYVAGRFANLGLEIDGEVVKRSYSLGSRPGEPPEFYIVKVEGGVLTPRLHDLGVGDEVLVSPRASGFFTLDEVPDARDLWMVATGTGIAPYLAMLRTGTGLDRFERIVVVHGVRHLADLGYRAELEAMAAAGTITYVPACSREQTDGVLHGRIPDRISDGTLEQRAQAKLSPADSHVMLCGNPGMIDGTVSALQEREMTKHRRRRPGHISFEKYW